MKKNKIITASMVALLSVSTLGAGVTAFAEENVDGYNSQASISFVSQNKGTTDPTDPDAKKPGETDPEHNEGTGMKGPLSLDMVPNIGFGEHYQLDGKLSYETINKDPQIQVTDTRSERGDGWQLTATAKPLTFVENSNSYILKGATIRFKAPSSIMKYTKYTTTTIDGVEHLKPTDGIDIIDSMPNGLTAGAFDLNVGDQEANTANVASASTNAEGAIDPGLFTTTFHYGKHANASDNVTLEFAEGVVKKVGTYTSTITWNLTSGATY